MATSNTDFKVKGGMRVTANVTISGNVTTQNTIITYNQGNTSSPTASANSSAGDATGMTMLYPGPQQKLTSITGNVNIGNVLQQKGAMVVNGSVIVGNVTMNTSGIFVNSGSSGAGLTPTGFTGNGTLVTSVTASTLQGNSAQDLIDKSDDAYSNVATEITAGFATAYSNATSHADTKAAEAYTNVVSDVSNASTIDNGTLAAPLVTGSYPALTVGGSQTNGVANDSQISGTYPGLTVNNVKPRINVFTSNGQFTAPPSTTLVKVTVTGGGGGGGASQNSSGGGGGGAGATTTSYVEVAAGEVCNVIVGLGGTGGDDANSDVIAGANGGISSFTTNTTTMRLYSNTDDLYLVNPNNSGEAYTYYLSNSGLNNTMVNPNEVGAASNDYFGWTVDLNRHHMVVGAWGERNSSNVGNSGYVYVYGNTGGTLTYALPSPNTTSSDKFGFSIALNDDSQSNKSALLVGAPDADANGITDSGAVHMVKVETESIQFSVNTPYSATNDAQAFGISVDINKDSNNVFIVGAPNTALSVEYVLQQNASANEYVANRGRAYIYSYSTSGSWSYTLESILENPDLAEYRSYNFNNANTNFGGSVSIGEKYALVGARYAGYTVYSQLRPWWGFENDSSPTAKRKGASYIYRANGQFLGTMASPIGTINQNGFGIGNTVKVTSTALYSAAISGKSPSINQSAGVIQATLITDVDSWVANNQFAKERPMVFQKTANTNDVSLNNFLEANTFNPSDNGAVRRNTSVAAPVSTRIQGVDWGYANSTEFTAAPAEQLAPYSANNGALVKKLQVNGPASTYPGPTDSREFGTVAMGNNYAIVAQPSYANGTGIVKIYHVGNTTTSATIPGSSVGSFGDVSGPSNYYGIGTTVTMSPDDTYFAFTGGWGPSSFPGNVYVGYTGNTHITEINAPIGTANQGADNFGKQIGDMAMSDTYLAVGAGSANATGNNQDGNIFVFRNSNNEHLYTITGDKSTGGNSHQLGHMVDINDNGYVAAGSYAPGTTNTRGHFGVYHLANGDLVWEKTGDDITTELGLSPAGLHVYRAAEFTLAFNSNATTLAVGLKWWDGANNVSAGYGVGFFRTSNGELMHTIRRDGSKGALGERFKSGMWRSLQASPSPFPSSNNDYFVVLDTQFANAEGGVSTVPISGPGAPAASYMNDAHKIWAFNVSNTAANAVAKIYATTSQHYRRSRVGEHPVSQGFDSFPDSNRTNWSYNGKAGRTLAIPTNGKYLWTFDGSGEFPDSAPTTYPFQIGIYQMGLNSVNTSYDIYNPNPVLNPSGLGDYFGNTIGGDSNTLIVGAAKEDSSEGRAYTYHAANGTLIDTFITPNAPITNEEYGQGVAVYDQTIAIGASGTTGANGALAANINFKTSITASGGRGGSQANLVQWGYSSWNGIPVAPVEYNQLHSRGEAAPGYGGSVSPQNQNLLDADSGNGRGLMSFEGGYGGHGQLTGEMSGVRDELYPSNTSTNTVISSRVGNGTYLPLDGSGYVSVSNTALGPVTWTSANTRTYTPGFGGHGGQSHWGSGYGAGGKGGDDHVYPSPSTPADGTTSNGASGEDGVVIVEY